MRFVAMIAAVVGSVLSQSAFAQLPQTRLSSIFPPGAQKGTTVEVTVGGGTDLDELDQMVFSHPGIVATPKMDANGVMVANVFAVTIAADVPPGLYDCRVRGLFGVSNPRLFRIDTLPEIAEVEPNNVRAQATPVTLGSIVNARANGGTDVDFYSVKVTTGQTLVLRSECARLDSPMQPWIQLFAANGRRLAESRRVFGQEANLVFTATQDEELIVRVQDTVYGGGDQFVYRLSFDSRSLVDWIEPSFVAANGPTNVTLFGRHLPGGTPTEKKLAGHAVFQQQVTIDPATARGPSEHQPQRHSRIRSGGMGSMAILFVLVRANAPQCRKQSIQPSNLSRHLLTSRAHSRNVPMKTSIASMQRKAKRGSSKSSRSGWDRTQILC